MIFYDSGFSFYKFISNHWFMGMPVLLLLLYMLPYVLLGENAYILIHDNIDSVYVTMEVLVNSGMLFSPSESIVPQLNLPRLSFGSEWNLLVLLFYFLPSFWAYVLNIIIIKCVAFIGMYCILSYCFREDREIKYIAVGVAACFASLPFFAMAGLSVASMPLMLYAYLKIYRGEDNLANWLTILLVPFYCGFIYSYIFLLFALYVYFFVAWLLTKQSNFRLFVALSLTLSVFLLIEYRLILNIIDPVFVSHREEFYIPVMTFYDAFFRAWNNFIYGQYHSASLHTYIILPTVLLALFLGLVSRNVTQYMNVIFLLIVLIVVASLFYGLWKWQGLEYLKQSIVIVNSFNFSRFHWLHPVLWYLVFAFSLAVIIDKFPRLTWGLMPIFAAQIYISGVQQHEVISQKNKHGIKYSELMSETLFADIGRYIDKPKSSYRVASLGLHPAIALHNGFYTIDFYINYYPLEYKKRFRKIIEGELSKNEKAMRYYDGWGSRVYLYSDELGKSYLGQEKSLIVSDLRWDIEAMRDMGAKYVLSTVPIDNKLNFLKRFDSAECCLSIYLYEVNGSSEDKI